MEIDPVYHGICHPYSNRRFILLGIHLMPSQSRGPLVLRTIKDVLGLAADALKGIGIPGVEAIPAIPLRIIAIFEVCVHAIGDLL